MNGRIVIKLIFSMLENGFEVVIKKIKIRETYFFQTNEPRKCLMHRLNDDFPVISTEIY